MNGCGRFVGRVGTLAVALGIGTALFDGYGVALAETDTASDGGNPRSSSSEGTDGSGEASTDSGVRTPTNTTIGTSRAPRTADQPQVSEPRTSTQLLERAARRFGLDPTDDNPGLRRGLLRPDRSLPGLAPISAKSGVPEPAPHNVPDAGETPPPAAEDLSTSTATLPEPPVSETPSDSVHRSWRGWPLPVSLAPTDDTEPVRSASGVTQRGRGELAGPIATALAGFTHRQSAPRTNLDRNITAAIPAPTPPTEESNNDPFDGSAAGGTAGITAFANAAPSSVAAPTPTNFITGLLSAVGLGAFLAPNAPATPAEVPVAWAILAWVRRQFTYSFDNKTPLPSTQIVATQPETPTSTTGFTLTGATDPDPEDAVTYQPGTYIAASGATLVVHTDGTATYTPAAGWTGDSAATDVFTVTTTDDGDRWHVHGIPGLLHAATFGILGSPGHTSTHTVTVNAGTPPATVIDAEVGAIDTAGNGTVTGTIGWTSPGGGTVSYANPDPEGTNTWTTTEGGTVTVNPDGTFTYTPDVWDRLNAYTNPDRNTDTFTVHATDENGSTYTLTVTVPVDPTGAAVTDGVSSPGITGGSSTSYGADGTVAVTTYTTNPDGTSDYTVHVLRPGETDPIDITATDVVNGSTQVGADGTVTLTTAVANPAGGYDYTVHVLRPGETGTTTITATNVVNDVVNGATQVGDDGTVALTTYTNSPDGGYDFTVRVLRPGETSTTTITATNAGGGYTQVAADGTVTLTAAVANPAGGYNYTVRVLRPGETSTTTITATDIDGGDTHVGDNGTVALSTYTNNPDGTSDYTVRVLRPGETDPIDITATNVTISDTHVGDDGTVTLTTAVANPAGGDDYTVRVLRPGETGTVHITATGSYGGGTKVGADGTVTLTTAVANPAGGLDYTVHVLRPGETDPIDITATDIDGGYTQVGADGTVALTTYTNNADGTSDYTVHVLRPGETDPTNITATSASLGTGTGTQIGADGTVALTTRTGAGTTADPYRYTVTVLRNGTDEPESITATGAALGAGTHVGPDGTVTLTTFTGPGSGGGMTGPFGPGTDADLYTTTVTVLRPNQPPQTVTIIGHPASAGGTQVQDDGTVTVTTRSGNATDGYVYTVSVITLADPPDTEIVL